MMPSRFHATAPTSVDDAALRDILCRTPLPGSVSVTLEREPSFFGGSLDALRHDVVTVRDSKQIIAGLGSRCERTAWLNGQPETVAYLGDLRVLPHYRSASGRILIEGFRHLRELESLRPVSAVYTAIFEDNTRARNVLVGGRAGLPHYLDLGRLHCPALLVRRRMTQPKPSRYLFRHATDSDIPAIVSFLNRTFQHRDLAPLHSAEDFHAGLRWKGLRAEDFITAWDGERMVGCLALWDLRAFRQIRVQGYQGWLKHIQPVISLTMRCLGWQGLTRPGGMVPAAFASFFAAADNDIGLARLLLNHARYEAARRGIGLLFTCMHELDPMLPSLRGWMSIPTVGRLYEVSFDGVPRLSLSRVPHVEAATL